MSTQLKFDGPRLDELLERVGRELGSDAVILEANRTRRGGVGGFFAKEWFEVVVADPGGSDDQDRHDAPEDGTSPVRSAVEDPLLALADEVTDRVETPRSPAMPSVDVTHGLGAGADRTGDAPAAAVSESFSRVLARVGGPSAHTAPTTAPTVSASASPSAESPSAAVPPAAVPVAERLAVDTSTPAAEASARLRQPAGVAAPRTRRLRDLSLAEMLAHLDRIVATEVLPSGPAVVTVVGDLSISRGVAAALAARVGLGEADVVVASPAARDDVPAWLRIDSADTARSRVARWRRSEQPVVVAVDLVPGREGHAWAADVLAALDADQVRLVARAWQVTDELGPKSAILGGVDGLELVDVEAAGEPEAFLELDLPVLGIDGRPASPELWAALLMERRNDVSL